MSNLKRWKKQGGGGGFFKWVDIGQSIEGIWEGQHDGKFGPMGNVREASGTSRAFPLHTGLLNQMEDIAEGTEVKIVYMGTRNNPKTGRNYKSFEVYTAEAAVEGGDITETEKEELPF